MVTGSPARIVQYTTTKNVQCDMKSKKKPGVAVFRESPENMSQKVIYGFKFQCKQKLLFVELLVKMVTNFCLLRLRVA